MYPRRLFLITPVCSLEANREVQVLLIVPQKASVVLCVWEIKCLGPEERIEKMQVGVGTSTRASRKTGMKQQCNLLLYRIVHQAIGYTAVQTVYTVAITSSRRYHC